MSDITSDITLASESTDVAARASAVLAAAGASTRFGSAKMLADAGGEPLLRRVARAFVGAGFCEVVVVLGARAEEVGRALEGLPVRKVVHSGWEAGMFSSVKAGLAALRLPSVRVAVSPADLPGLDPGIVYRIVSTARDVDETTLVVPVHDGRRGHPLVLPRRLVPRLLAWPDDAKLSDLLSAPGLAVRAVEGFGPEVLRDVDRPGDLGGRREG